MGDCDDQFFSLPAKISISGEKYGLISYHDQKNTFFNMTISPEKVSCCVSDIIMKVNISSKQAFN
jgi:hypothetical protein